MKPITENQIEEYALTELQALGYSYVHGAVISPGGEGQERESFEQIILTDRLRNAVARINPHIPADAREQTHRKKVTAHRSKSRKPLQRADVSTPSTSRNITT